MSDALRRQVVQHLQSLQLAGVEFVPRLAASLRIEPTTDGGKRVDDARPVVPSLPSPNSHAAGGFEVDASSRRAQLSVLASEVASCKRCSELAFTRTQTVFGVGPLDPVLCFIGEAPGADEDRQGEPFVGAAGQLLDKIIVAMGLKREEVFICNILRCRPPGNRQPRTDEAQNCRAFLESTLELVRPPYICALGLTAAQNLLQSHASLRQLRGKFHSYKGIPVICTYHPAALLPSRSPEKKKDVWDDMKMLLSHMGRAIPGNNR